MDYGELAIIAGALAAHSGLVKEIYGDLAKPGVSQVGKAIETVLGLGNTVLWPIQLINERAKIALENNLNKYREELKDVTDDEILPVRPEVGVPILEKLAYVTDDQISDLYINLLSKASTVQTAHLAHPSFVNIINNLSPDEALLLKHLQSKGFVPFLRGSARDKGTAQIAIISDIFTGLEDEVQLSFKQNISAYFSNFEGLGLVHIQYGARMTEPGLYDSVKTRYEATVADLRREVEEDENLHFVYQHGIFNMTEFGRLFLSACFKKLKDS